MKKSVLVGCIFVSIISGILIGIIVHFNSNRVLEEATLKEVENANNLVEKYENIIETGTLKVKTSPNTKIVYETLYLECNHLESKEENIDAGDVNQDENYFLNKYIDWDVKSFSDERVELYKQQVGICDKHYVVKKMDNYIAVYTLDSEGNQNLKEITDILTVYLPQEDVDLLEKGINVCGDNELAKLLGDYE